MITVDRTMVGFTKANIDRIGFREWASDALWKHFFALNDIPRCNWNPILKYYDEKFTDL